MLACFVKKRKACEAKEGEKENGEPIKDGGEVAGGVEQ